MSESVSSSREPGTIPEPVMKLTGYDRLSAGMIAMVLGLVLLVIAAIIYWATTRPERQTQLVAMEMVEISGGVPDGAPDETLKVESPEDPNENPSEVEEEVDLTEIVDNVVELADQATQQAQKVVAVNEFSGSPGSADGNGRRGLGDGPGQGGIPNDQRWFIRYSDDSSIAQYAKQLDHFGIEMGALLPNGQLVLISNMSGSTKKTIKTSGKGEDRLYMTWQAGNRKAADVELFKRAGVDVTGAILFHFYPKKTEQLLFQTEFDYAKRKASEIRRTYFVVVKKGSAFSFVVTRQTYLR